jgi:hypothetical protein
MTPTADGDEFGLRDACKGEMNIQTRRRLDRDTAENLLNGVRGGSYADHYMLVSLLTAAAAPARPGELASEQASLAALRIARLVPTVEPRRPSMIKAMVMKILTVKAGVALATVTAAGGVALAASTGNLPTALTGAGHAGVSASASASPGAGNPSVDPSASNGKDKGESPGAHGSPSPSLVGLCHAVSAGNKTEQGKALESPAFTALITAAGGKDKVAAFCTAVLASASAEPKASHPADGTKPSERPAERPSGTPGATDNHGKPSTTPRP